MNIAFMFSGQGSQYVGMCKELYLEYDIVRNRFEEAATVLGYDVADIMFEQEERLNDTLYTQPLMFVMYASIVDVLKSIGIQSTFTCGLSLGEYGAYYDAGVIDFKQGLLLLQARGLFMQEASEETSGIMSALLGIDAEILEGIIAQEKGYVTIANYNTYGQLVISGEEESVKRVNEKALEQGAKRAIVLNTSGPFHSILMQQARKRFETFIEPLEFHEPQKKLLVNTTGTYFEGNVKQTMAQQITSSVKFYHMIETVVQEGVKTFVEIGPKKTLCSFVKKIDRGATLCNIEDLSSLQATLKKLEETDGI
jgi:[acyl-carrier-protein] S-malonyltransferase